MHALTREKVKGADNGQVYNRQINGHISLPTNHYRLNLLLVPIVNIATTIFI
jgi:hypothetical protein